MATAAQRIAEQFPFLAFLANDPEVGPLLTRAVDVNTGFSPEKFRAEMMKTKWWRSQSESQRAGAIMAATDPGSWRELNRSTAAGIGAMEQRLGVRLSANERKWIANIAAAKGWGADSRELLDAVIRTGKRHGVVHGAIQTGTELVKAVSVGEYFYRIPQKDADHWGSMIAKGDATIEDFKASISKKAWNWYPHLRDQLKLGMTLADITEKYRTVVAEELSLPSLGAVDMNTARWKPLLGVKDAKTGKMRMPTEMEVIKMARSDPAWWNTAHGQEADAQAATAMAGVFGQRAEIGGG